MRKKRLVLLGAAVLVACAGVFIFRPRPATSPAVTLHYVSELSSGNGPVFWLTNNSDKSLLITLMAVEFQKAGVWKTYTNIPHVIGLSLNGFGKFSLIGPHASGTGYTDSPVCLPTNGTWRLRFSIGEKLEGIDRIFTVVTREPRVLKNWRDSGNSSFLRNPFSKNITYFGNRSFVFSEPVIPRKDAPL